eukprot:m.1105463 g.1105463  ORF g.1105463 m.1105463 type:complete len:91 (+) comp24339_c0_seq4:2858-3130(+)
MERMYVGFTELTLQLQAPQRHPSASVTFSVRPATYDDRWNHMQEKRTTGIYSSAVSKSRGLISIWNEVCGRVTWMATRKILKRGVQNLGQ